MVVIFLFQVLGAAKIDADCHLRNGYDWEIRVWLGDEGWITQLNRLGDLGTNWVICHPNWAKLSKILFRFATPKRVFWIVLAHLGGKSPSLWLKSPSPFNWVINPLSPSETLITQSYQFLRGESAWCIRSRTSLSILVRWTGWPAGPRRALSCKCLEGYPHKEGIRSLRNIPRNCCDACFQGSQSMHQ